MSRSTIIVFHPVATVSRAITMEHVMVKPVNAVKRMELQNILVKVV